LDYEIRDEKNWRKVVDIAVPAEDVQPQLDEKYKEYQKNLKIGGFRKGKVPLQLIKKMFGKQIETEIFEPFISDAWKKLFEEIKLDPIDTPRLSDLQYDPKTGLKFAISFDVRPEFEVTGYDGMRVDKEVYEITDKDVEDTLERIRQDNAMIYTVEGEAQVGHYLICDLQELDETGVPVVGRKYEDQTLYLQEDGEVTPQLVGVKVGEERRVKVGGKKERSGVVETGEEEEEAPEQYYLVKVKEIKERKVPELDDELAKDVGDFENLEELKTDVRNRLEKEAAQRTEYLFHQALADELIKIVGIDVPQSMLENYLDSIVKQAKAENQGKVDEQQVREYYRPIATRNLKWLLISRQLIEQENITVSDEEVDARIEAIEMEGEDGKQRAKELRDDKEKREDLKEQMLEEKVYEFLATRAEINEIKKTLHKEEEKSELEV